jgi:hypothetical protein
MLLHEVVEHFAVIGQVRGVEVDVRGYAGLERGLSALQP